VKKRFGLAALLAAIVVTVVVVVAGCGSSNSASSTTSSSGSQSSNASRTAFRQCLQAHGVTPPSGPPQRGQRPTFNSKTRAAFQACSQYRPQGQGGGFGQGGGQPPGFGS
jgi:hypothetical protein